MKTKLLLEAKTKLLLATLICLLLSNFSQSQIVNIPDYEFKQALLNYTPNIDTNNDNEIQVTEATAITTLNISGYQGWEDAGGGCLDPNDPNCCTDPNDPNCINVGGPGAIFPGISDFTGIEAFVNLTSLICSSNDLTSLDVSSLTQLTYLDCSNNQNPNFITTPYPGISTLVLPSSGSLETLHSGYNDLGTLDVSLQTSLKTLKTSFNHINTLILPNTNNLTYLDTSRNQLTTLDLSVFTSLTGLVCDNNNINTLTLPITNTLTSINCQRNQITTLDASPYISLISLICDNNSINSITLPNTNTLTTLKCFVNQIPSLDVSNNTGLTLLDCRNNPLTNLNLLQNTALSTLNCSATQLTSLDVTNNTLLSTIACGGNQITSLDLSRQTNLHTFYGNNNLLTSLNIKNGNNTAISNSRFNILNNPNLRLICVDNLSYANSTFTNKDGQAYYSDICSFIPTNSNTITGIVSFDFDANGCDATDTKSINTKLTNIGTSTSNITFTDTNGQYIMYTQEATNTLNIFPNLPSFFTVTPTTQSSTFTGSGNTETIDFCITANQVVNDIKVTVFGTSEARPGFDTSVRIYYENIGSSILSGTVDLGFLDTQLNYLNFTPSDSTVTLDSSTSTSLTWSYVNLNPFEKGYIDVYFTINTPVETTNPVFGGDLIVYTSNITTTATDVNVADNTSTFSEIVVNAYDPNDIICFEGDYIDAVEVPNFLNYRVRFQNTGSASAINIVVKNELDTDLDWDTFTPISASHSYRPSLTDGNKLEFIFENIHLADSLSNEPESHGWIFFKIKPKSTFSLSDIAENTSYIYFDYNAPVITNTTTTQLTRIATLTTTAADNISQTGADLAGNISANGGASISERGIVYALTSENGNPEIGGTNVIKVNSGTGIGTFTNPISGLTANTQYSFKSYAINSAGTNYGNLDTFTTSALLVPTINFTDISKTYGDLDFQLNATSNSTGKISFTIEGNTNGTSLLGVNNDFINIGNASTVTIRASVASDNNYDANTKDITLTINKATLTITADDVTKVYGSANPTLTMQYAGFVNTDDKSIIDTEPIITSTATATSDVGDHDIVLANGRDNNYSFSLVNGTLSITKKTISITADDVTKNIGDIDPTLTYQITDGNLVNGDSFSGNLSRISGESIGTYEIQIGSLTSGNNYNENFTEGVFTISSTASVVSDFIDKNLKIYPNPVTDILTLELSGLFKIKKIKVFTVLGKLIKESTKETIDLSEISTGIYIVKIISDNGIATQKIIKE